MEVRHYNPSNWFTQEGVWKKRRELEKKGVPNMRKWRFITLTLDQDRIEGGPVEGYFAGKDRLRRFVGLVRDHFGGKVSGCWKLEFHANGWPHWHMLISIRRKLSHQEMRLLSRWWNLGRVNVEMVRDEKGWDYLFKYVFKSAVKDGLSVPEWFLDYYDVRVDPDGEKFAVSMQRVRFFQSFGEFFTGKPVLKETERKEPETCLVVFPVRENWERSQRTLVCCARAADGTYLGGSVVEAAVPLGELYSFLSMLVLEGKATCPRPLEFVVAAIHIKDKIQWQTKQQLLKRDRQLVHRRPINQPF